MEQIGLFEPEKIEQEPVEYKSEIGDWLMRELDEMNRRGEEDLARLESMLARLNAGTPKTEPTERNVSTEPGMANKKQGHVIKVDQVALEILERSTVEGNILRLPPDQLERKMYQTVNEVITCIGGKWDKSKKGHVFESDPSEALEQVLLTGEATDTKKQFQFFETPDSLADRLVELAQIRDSHLILEPSAGKGAIVSAIQRVSKAKIDACEIQEPNRAVLETLGVNLQHGDFLEYYQPNHYDRIIANPPFTKQQDIQHVTHMIECLKPGGVLVSVMSNGVTFRTDRRTQDFKLALSISEHGILPVESGAFAESGTMVNTIILKLAKAGTD